MRSDLLRHPAGWFGKWVPLVLLAVVAAGCGGGANVATEAEGTSEEDPSPVTADETDASGDGLTPIRLGLSSSGLGFLPAYIAESEDFFADEGLDVSVSRFDGGGAATQALLGGQLDVVLAGANEPLNAIVEGRDMKVFFGATLGALYEWWARPDIESVDDIAGERIAVSGIGGLSHLLSEHFVTSEGYEADEVEMVPAGGERLAALRAGQVDIAAISPPETFLAEEEGYVLVGTLREHLDTYLQDVYAAPEAFINENPDSIAALVRSIQRAIETIQNDEDVTIRVMMDELSFEEDIARQGRTFMLDANAYRIDGHIPQDAYDFFIETTIAGGDLDEPIEYEEYVVSDYMGEGD